MPPCVPVTAALHHIKLARLRSSWAVHRTAMHARCMASRNAVTEYLSQQLPALGMFVLQLLCMRAHVPQTHATLCSTCAAGLTARPGAVQSAHCL